MDTRYSGHRIGVKTLAFGNNSSARRQSPAHRPTNDEAINRKAHCTWFGDRIRCREVLSDVGAGVGMKMVTAII